VKLYGAIDIGGSMYIHVFGAYLGLTIAWLSSNDSSFVKDNNHSSYHSNLFSIIGTVFLWMFWPSFNCALAVGGNQHRVVINTILSLCASCVVTFCWSGIFRRGKFDIVEIQNATLAGGVAIGCSSDLVIQPYGALIIGFVAGTISTIGFCKIMPLLERYLGLHDTAGIHNLHAMPGILGGLGGIFAALTADDKFAQKVYPTRVPCNETLDFGFGAEPRCGRSKELQASFQAAALFTSLAIAIIGGLFTYGILQIPIVCRVETKVYFVDVPFWHEMPYDYPGKKKTRHEVDISKLEPKAADENSRSSHSRNDNSEKIL